MFCLFLVSNVENIEEVQVQQAMEGLCWHFENVLWLHTYNYFNVV